MSDLSTKKIGFIGLGAMGVHMASHLSTSTNPVVVFNRTLAKAADHATTYGTVHAESLEDLAKACSEGVIFLSLPSSQETTDIINAMLPYLNESCIIVDTTSGEPAVSKEQADMLKSKKIHLVDAPVSGGPKGAETGTLTSMLGGEDSIVGAVIDLIGATYSKKKCVHCGPIGSGMAVSIISFSSFSSSPSLNLWLY